MDIKVTEVSHGMMHGVRDSIEGEYECTMYRVQIPHPTGKLQFVEINKYIYETNPTIALKLFASALIKLLEDEAHA